MDKDKAVISNSKRLRGNQEQNAIWDGPLRFRRDYQKVKGLVQVCNGMEVSKAHCGCAVQ